MAKKLLKILKNGELEEDDNGGFGGGGGGDERGGGSADPIVCEQASGVCELLELDETRRGVLYLDQASRKYWAALPLQPLQ